MNQPEPSKFTLTFKKSSQQTLLPNTPLDLLSVFRSLFPNASKYPNNALIFKILHPQYKVHYNIEHPSEVKPDSHVKVTINTEKLPIDVLQGPAPTLKKSGPFNFEKTVKLRGLAWECDEYEIRSFFEGLEIPPGGVHIIYNGAKIKRHSGDAFVEFAEAASVQKALEKDRQCIYGRYVEVMQTKKEEINRYKMKAFELARYKCKSVPVDDNSIVLKLLGLPWETTYSDVKEFVDDVPLTAIHFPKDKLGRPNGTAYIEVADQEFCARAMGHQREYIGKRFVDIKKVTMAELLIDMSPGDELDSSRRAIDKTFCLLVRSLPASLNNFAIENFFKQKSASPFRIHKKINGTEAYCEFNRKSDFLIALNMSGEFLEGNQVQVFEVSYEEVARNVGFINM